MIKAFHRAIRRALVVLLVPATVITLTTVALTTVAAPGAGAYTNTTDLVFVHGYGDCQNVAESGAGPMQSQYYFQNQPAETLHSVEFYGCDTGGESIIGAGPLNKFYYPSSDRHGKNTDIRHIGYELAWYLYENFTLKNLPVNLVGLSMGGLVISWALQRVQAHDRWFPPTLDVRTVVAFATPFAGFSYNCVPRNVQCAQFTTGSSLTSQIRARSAGQPSSTPTVWLLVGSTGCDLVPASSSLALSGAHYAVNYVVPCYDHTGYVYDTSDSRDAVAFVNGEPVVGGMHSLALMQWALL